MTAEQTAQTVIDLDDPEFQIEQELDPNQDIDARIPPPELDVNGNAIDYMLKLSIGDNKEGQKKPFAKVTKSDNPKKYLALNVKAQVIAEGTPFDNAFVNFPFGSVSTMSFNNTTSAMNLARVLGQPMPAKISQLDQMAYIVALLETEPKIPARLQWTGYCTGCEKDVPTLTGEKRWPPKHNEAGELVGHEAKIECEECGTEINAKVGIKTLIPIKG